MKIVFFGTPEYVVPILAKLCETYNSSREKNVVGIVTQPPKPAGREKRMEHSAVDNWAFKKGLSLITEIADAPEADLGVCAAYGAIVPQMVIDRFQYGILNVHPSLLPKYRGASPIQAALVTGEEETGVSIIKMDAELDHGELVSSFREKIEKDDTNETLRTRLFARASEFLIELIPSYVNNKIKLEEQEHKNASYCKVIRKVDGFIDPEYLAAALEGKMLKEEWRVEFIEGYSQEPNTTNIERFIRAMDPWPTAWTNIEMGLGKIKRLKLVAAHAEEKKLVLERVQLEGKGTVSWKQFKEGYPGAKFS